MGDSFKNGEKSKQATGVFSLAFEGNIEEAQNFELDFVNTKQEAKNLGYSHVMYRSSPDNGLVLKDIGHKSGSRLMVDFTGGKTGHRLAMDIVKGSRKTPQLLKAAGFVNGKELTVLDATAGFGTDGFVFAAAGCRVTMIERVRWVYAMLEDGIKRAGDCEKLKELISRVKLVNEDAVNHLKKMVQLGEKKHVVYLDPMFYGEKKTALPKKEMQFLHVLLKNENTMDSLQKMNRIKNDELLFELAVRCAQKRVVVKRNLKLEPIVPLTSKKPELVLKGKTTRYDVYIL